MSKQDPPFSYTELLKKFKNRERKNDELEKIIDFNLVSNVPLDKNAELSIKQFKNSKYNLEYSQKVISVKQSLGAIGKHTFPPKVRNKFVEDKGDMSEIDSIPLKPNIPKHLAYKLLSDDASKSVNPKSWIKY